MQTGLQQVDDGLAQLYGGIGQLPAKAKPLHDGIAQLQAGIGSVKDPASLAGGIDTIRGKIADAVKTGSSLDQLRGGVDASKAGVDKIKPGIEQAKGGVDQELKKGMDDGLAKGGGIDQLAGRCRCREEQRRLWAGDARPSSDKVADGLSQLRTQTQAGSDGLGQVSDGLRSGRSRARPGLGRSRPGVSRAGTAQDQPDRGEPRPGCGRVRRGQHDAPGL